MNVILFGATGMIGQGVLRECLLNPDIDGILAIVRTPTGQQHEKLKEIKHENFLDFSGISEELRGYDACFFCLGVSTAGRSRLDYLQTTYDITLAAAQILANLNRDMVFIYVSGAGTDSTENSRAMWARVKGRTENALLRLPFREAYMFRPAFIQPLHGAVSKTTLYRILYAVLAPFFPVLRLLFPRKITTTEQLGRAMVRVAQCGFPSPVLESEDINAV